MDIDAYLGRIGLTGRPPPTLEGLRALHRAHLAAIPYENFDVQLGRPVTIAVPAIYDKIVGRRRGGWCYEMNGLFGWALGELGFKVTRATGAVMRAAAGDAVIGNHLVLRVDLPEGVHLADVGFGDGPNEPFAVREGTFDSNGFPYAVERTGDGWWRLVNHPAGGAASFDFDPHPADETRLAAKCDELQTAETSVFVQNAVAFRQTPGAIDVLRGRVALRIRPDGTGKRLIENADDLIATLKDVFALDLPEAAGLWDKIAARHEQVMAEREAAKAAASPA
ncbi:MAG: arylamine N-acetyltransferase [Alphaproteobacteria bacterium]